jgi:hypothetical protein
MVGAKHLATPVVLLFIVLLSSHFADGLVFLSSNHTHSALSFHIAQHQVAESPASHEGTDAWERTWKNMVKKEAARENAAAEAHAGEKDREYAKQYGKGDIEFVQKRYPFIYAAHEFLAHFLGKIYEHWYQDWKLWVGLSLWSLGWAKWLKYGYDEVYWQRLIIAFGLNIVILHILQYATTIRAGMLCVGLLLGGQAITQTLLTFANEVREEEGDKFLCDTLYMDLSLPGLQIGILFVSQCCVWWFYMTSIVFQLDFEHVNYFFWLMAYMTMQMTMIMCRGEDSVLGSAFPVHDVHFLYTHCDKITVSVEDSNMEPFKISKANIFLRGLTGFFCNAILREIMSYTIPLMLMLFSEPMDFVVYCVGVNFICTIDDMSDRTFLVHTKSDEAPRGARA